MRDGTARAIAEELERRINNLEAKVVFIYGCPKCGEDTPHSTLYVSKKAGIYRKVSEQLSGCIGLNIHPATKCHQCHSIFVEGQQEIELMSKKP